jgi:hypothetical protein
MYDRGVIDALTSALERTQRNFVLAVQGKPVRDMCENLAENAAALAAVPQGQGARAEPDVVADHAWIGVAGHPDDDECTYRSDGTDETYCGRTEAEHMESTR